jgi:hypothetical protein
MAKTNRRAGLGKGPKHRISADLAKKPILHTITDASNAKPIQVTSNRHGLATGDFVFIGGIVGNTAANGFFKVGNTTANTFDLLDASGTAVQGSGEYESGGKWTLALRAKTGATAAITKLVVRDPESTETCVEATIQPGSNEWIDGVELYTDNNGAPDQKVGDLYEVGAGNKWDAYVDEVDGPHPQNGATYHVVTWVTATIFNCEGGTVPIP